MEALKKGGSAGDAAATVALTEIATQLVAASDLREVQSLRPEEA